ncbi:MAG: hypothetical protein M1823_006576, partial [Watsoniomyces obsoletus]
RRLLSRRRRLGPRTRKTPDSGTRSEPWEAAAAAPQALRRRPSGLRRSAGRAPSAPRRSRRSRGCPTGRRRCSRRSTRRSVPTRWQACSSTRRCAKATSSCSRTALAYSGASPASATPWRTSSARRGPKPSRLRRARSWPPCRSARTTPGVPRRRLRQAGWHRANRTSTSRAPCRRRDAPSP